MIVPTVPVRYQTPRMTSKLTAIDFRDVMTGNFPGHDSIVTESDRQMGVKNFADHTLHVADVERVVVKSSGE